MLAAQRDTPSLFSRITRVVPRWLRWGIGITAVALPFLAFRYGHDFKQAVKVQLSRWDVAQAGPLLADPLTAEEGVHLLVTALIRTPEEPAVLRALAELTADAGLSAHARFFYEHLSRITPLTPEDELQRARVLARLSDRSGAQIILQKLAEAHGDTPEILRARADIATEAADHSQARAVLEKLLRAAPAAPETGFDLARARALSPEAAQQRQGIDKLLDLFEASLTERDPSRRIHCFWTLSSLDLPEEAQRARFAALIERMPLQNLERRVVQRFLAWSLDPADADRSKLRAWLKELITTESRASADERLHVAKILQRHGEHDLVLQWITFEQGLGETGLCTTRIDSLLALRLWNQARHMVEDRTTPLVRPLQAILQAQIEMLSTGGKSVQSTELLGAALQAARDKGEQGNFIALGRLAAEFGHHAKALEAYGLAMQPQFPAATFLVEPLMKAGREAGVSAGEVLRLLRQRTQDERWNRELELYFDHLAVLAGEGVELVLEKHRQPDPAVPDFARRLLLHTLACHRLGDSTGLAAALRRLPAQHAWTPPQQVCLQALHQACGAAAGTPPTPAEVPLFAEEKRLLELAADASAK